MARQQGFCDKDRSRQARQIISLNRRQQMKLRLQRNVLEFDAVLNIVNDFVITHPTFV